MAATTPPAPATAASPVRMRTMCRTTPSHPSARLEAICWCQCASRRRPSPTPPHASNPCLCTWALLPGLPQNRSWMDLQQPCKMSMSVSCRTSLYRRSSRPFISLRRRRHLVQCRSTTTCLGQGLHRGMANTFVYQSLLARSVQRAAANARCTRRLTYGGWRSVAKSCSTQTTSLVGHRHLQAGSVMMANRLRQHWLQVHFIDESTNAS
jgi:hypothetical protein